jgi:hypothetical protein
MYGLIHVALRDLAIQKLGLVAWTEVSSQLDAPELPLSLEMYDDQLTQALFSEVSRRLELDGSEFLKQFGCHWISFIVKSNYSNILKYFGPDFRSCIANLDALHVSVCDTMQNARTPKFTILVNDAHRITIRYISQLKGLSPFVEGLLKGLLQHFNEQGEVSVLRSAPDHTDFLVTLNN